MVEQHRRMQGELALVTGSTSGIGVAIALAFAREGAVVCVTGRDKHRADEVAAAIRAAGGSASTVILDLCEIGAPAGLVAAASEALGGLTVVVNNASSSGHGDAAVGEISDEAWSAALSMNVTVPMAVCRSALPHMQRAGHGSIINISSRQAERASGGLSAYIASKSALNGLTRSIAVDYASSGIRCNTISPGYVRNERRDATLDATQRARVDAMHLTRIGIAEDVALAAVYLASTESAFVTGTNLQLDGGSSIARGATLG